MELINSVIMKLPVYSMELEIGQCFLFLSTSKQLWDVVSETYSNLHNSAQVFDIEMKT